MTRTMTLNKLVNKWALRKFDRLFLLVSNVKDGHLVLDKFYVDGKEYDSFAKRIMSGEEDNEKGLRGKQSFSYQWSSQTVDMESFLDLFKIKSQNANISSFIDEINSYLKNITIGLFSGGADIIPNDENRLIINSYFEERRDILEKTSANFPLRLESGIEQFDIIKFRMYNVGQANFSALLLGTEERPTMICDLGKSRKCKDAIHLLQNRLPVQGNPEGHITTIVISHYDNDHINMASDLPVCGAALQFFMPEFLHPSDIYKPNIQLLLYRAICNGGSICFFKNDSLSSPLAVEYATFYQGASQKRDINQSTNENSHGLIAYLSIRGKHVLVPGDVLYEDLFTSLPAPLKPEYVVIPHHCCEYRSTINPSFIDLSNLVESFTFCGPHAFYHHPNLSHLQHYGSKSMVRLARKGKKPTIFDKQARIVDTYYCVGYQAFYDWAL